MDNIIILASNCPALQRLCRGWFLHNSKLLGHKCLGLFPRPIAFGSRHTNSTESRNATMQFDDRLATVLRHRASGERAARTQFRQLLDLLGRRAAQGSTIGKSGGEQDENLMAAAWLRLGALGENISASERAAMIRDPGLRFRNPELAAHLAEDEPDVAAAALSRAQLSDEDWEALIPRLPIRARGFLRLRRDLSAPTQMLLERLGVHDRGLPQPETPASETAASETPAPEPVTKTEMPIAANDQTEQLEEDTPIGSLVKRIEAFRKARIQPDNTADAPRLPLGETAPAAETAGLSSFSFTADTNRRINWAEDSAAPMVTGASLAQTPIGEAMRFHQPIRNARITLEGGPAIAGDWVVEMQPRFSRPGGRFYGYAGLARRSAPGRLRRPETKQSAEADKLRQLLHELRTPVNAIQGFAEVIQQQLFGPTPNEYRALAAGIAGDSARMLAGFDELDRLAKLETGALELETGASDFAAIVKRLLDQLQAILKSRTSGLDLTTYANGVVAIDTDDAEALAWRLLATLVGAMGGGEHLQVELAEENGSFLLSFELPAVLAGKPDIFAASGRPGLKAVSAGMFGTGFSLRLARAEARSLGGQLERVDDWLLLSLPLLTEAGSEPSQSVSGKAG